MKLLMKDRHNTSKHVLAKHTTNQLTKALALAVFGLVMTACGDNDDTASSSDVQPAVTPQAKAKVAFTPKNLENLGADYDYEGWLITPSGAKATGPFDIDDANKTATQTFEVDAADAKAATAFVLTIEPAGETGAAAQAPSKVHVIGGDITNNTAIATTSHGAALGTDFSTASARYILATPSNENKTPTQGIWYLDNRSGTAQAGLTLPTLPAGWQYEGWIVDGGPITTGTFLTANQADSDKGGPAAGDKGTPPFPGQDFVNPAKDLVGKTAVISVEPDPDNSAAPFSIKPLVGIITNESGKMILENKAAGSLPEAMISITM